MLIQNAFFVNNVSEVVIGIFKANSRKYFYAFNTPTVTQAYYQKTE